MVPPIHPSYKAMNGNKYNTITELGMDLVPLKNSTTWNTADTLVSAQVD